jgi:hypothetical protein
MNKISKVTRQQTNEQEALRLSQLNKRIQEHFNQKAQINRAEKLNEYIRAREQNQSLSRIQTSSSNKLAHNQIS